MGGTFYEPRTPKHIEGFHEDSREGTFIAEAQTLIASDIPPHDKAILQGAINLVKAKEYFSKGFPPTAQEYLDQYPNFESKPLIFTGGALPPPGVAWQLGKTAASITFVNQAEQFLLLSDLTAEARALLTEGVSAVKSGAQVLTQWLSPEEYLKKSGF